MPDQWHIGVVAPQSESELVSVSNGQNALSASLRLPGQAHTSPMMFQWR